MVLKIANQIASTTPRDDPFDQLLGHFGLWQLLIYGSVSLVKLSSGWVQMAILFLTPNLTFRCSNMTIDFENELINSTDLGNSSIVDGIFSNSTLTIVDTLDSISPYAEVVNNTCYSNCKKYEYDAAPFDNTIISEWDLVCERRWLAGFTQMVLQFGILIGSIVFGFLSDRFGRKNTFLLAITTVITFGFCVPFSPNYALFTGARFLLGMATAGTMVVSFVIVMESVGAKYRAIIGCLFQIPFIIGHMTVPLFAYYYRSWEQYSLAMAVPPLIYLGYFFILTESPRWLLSVGRLDEAAQIVKKAALINRRPIVKIEETLRAASTDLSSTPKENPNYSSLFRGSLRLTTSCCCVLWLVTGVTFFGINQYIGQTSPDPFVSVVVAGAIQIPSNMFSMWLIGRFGRKMTTITFFTLGGLCIIALGCVPDYFALTLTLGSLGVSCTSIVAATIYIYTSELYPTVVRNMGLGASSTCMRIGSMLAPFISNLSVTIPWLPTVIFGLAPIAAALACLFLPETKGRILPDSLDDVQNENS